MPTFIFGGNDILELGEKTYLQNVLGEKTDSWLGETTYYRIWKKLGAYEPGGDFFENALERDNSKVWIFITRFLSCGKDHVWGFYLNGCELIALLFFWKKSVITFFRLLNFLLFWFFFLFWQIGLILPRCHILWLRENAFFSLGVMWEDGPCEYFQTFSLARKK